MLIMSLGALAERSLFGIGADAGDGTQAAPTQAADSFEIVGTEDSEALEAASQQNADALQDAAAAQASDTYTDKTLVVDGADLLTASQREQLEAEAQRISLTYGLYVSIVTTPSTQGKDIQYWAADYSDDTFGDTNGVMLAISMSPRKVYILTTRSGIYMFTDYGIDYILDDITGDLSAGRYGAACEQYLADVAAFVEEAVNNRPYDTDHRYNEHVATLGEKMTGALPVTGLLSVLVTLLGMGSMKKGMNTVKRNRTARQYAKANTLQLTRRSDLFLYRTTTRTRIPQQRSGGGSHGGGSHTFTSHSGISHGGGGRSF